MATGGSPCWKGRRRDKQSETVQTNDDENVDGEYAAFSKLSAAFQQPESRGIYGRVNVDVTGQLFMYDPDVGAQPEESLDTIDANL